MRSTLLILALALVGCKAENRDRDNDGLSPADGDCNDEDATVYAGAVEACDGKDQDCDGDIDEDAADASRWYADFDEDGFGDADLFARLCEKPDAYVDNGDDCDDQDALVFPGANEVCNGIDDDCDTTPDDNAGGLWFGDEDGDTFGDPEVVVTACDGESGVSADNTDCNDANADINPGHDEICDGLDNNCDGDVDTDAVDAPTWYDDGDDDGFGDILDEWVSCEAPPGYVENGDDCDDDSDAISPVASEYCDDLDNDCDAEVDEEPVDGATWYGDDDGDGFGDAGQTTVACDQPKNYADNPDDCDDTDETLNADTKWYADSDSDGFGNASSSLTQCAQPSGYVIDSEDCDDADADVNPDATEVCDGEDNDCDGVADGSGATDATTYYLDDDGDSYGDSRYYVEGCEAPGAEWVENDEDCDDADAAQNPDTVWYADTDGDGWGVSSKTKTECEQPSGYVSKTGDCDDSRSKSAPGSTEYCNTYDDDCDGSIDESDAADAKTWYADSDGDGYGNASKSSTSCSAATGYVSNSSDCDDTKGTLNPDTVWYRDADGDGYGDPSTTSKRCSQPSGYVSTSTDCDDTDATVNPTTVWYRDADSDGYGASASTKTQCAQPSGYIADAGDCDDTDGTTNPAGLEICDGADNDCDGTTDPSDAWWNENWPYRVPVTVTGGSYAIAGPPVLIDVDLKAALAAAGGSGAVDEDSVRVVVQDCDLGQPELPSQFIDDVKGLLSKKSHTDTTGDDDGTVAVLYDEDGDYGSLETLSAGETAKLAIYFGTTLDGLPAGSYSTDLSAASSQLANDQSEANFDRAAGGLLQDFYYTSGTTSSSLIDQRNTSGNGVNTTSGFLSAASSTGTLTLKADGPVLAIVQASGSRSNSAFAYSYTYTYAMFAGRPELYVKMQQKATSASTVYSPLGWSWGFVPWRANHTKLDGTSTTYASSSSYYALSNGTWGMGFGWYEAPTYRTNVTNSNGDHYIFANDYAAASSGTSASIASGTEYYGYDVAVLLPFAGAWSASGSASGQKLLGLMDGVSVTTSSGEAQ